MKFKKFLSLFLGVAALGSLAACNNNNSGSGSGTGGGGEGGGGSTGGNSFDIKVWVGESVVDLTKTQIDAYNKLETTKYKFNATVDAVSESKAGSTVIEDVDQAADIYCFAQDQLARLVEATGVAQLGTKAAEFVETNNDAGSVAASKVGEKTYAYPISSDNGYFMFYDKRVITDESHLQSLDMLLADCQAAGKNFSFECEENAWYTASFFFADGIDCESTWTTNADGTFAKATDTFNSDNGVIALKGLRKLLKNSRFISSAANDFTVAEGETSSAVVVSGTWISEAVQNTLGENMGVAPLPKFTVGDKSYQLGSFAGYKLMGVKPQKDAVKAAELHKLAQYLSGEKCQKERFEAVQWGPSNKVDQNLDAVKANKPLAALAKQSAYAVPQGQYPDLWWDIAGTLGPSVKALGDNAADTEYKAILEDYQRSINAIASTDGKRHTDLVWADYALSVVTDDGDISAPLAAVGDTGKKFSTDMVTFADNAKIRIKAEKTDGTVVMIGKKGDVQTAQHAILPIVVAEGGNYKVEVTIDDNNNANISVIPAKTVYSVSGTMNGWGDTDMTETATAGTFTVEVELAAGGEFKIKFNHGWDVNLGGPVASDQKYTINGSCDNPTQGGGNFTVTEAGTYVITLVVGENSYTVSCVKKAA